MRSWTHHRTSQDNLFRSQSAQKRSEHRRLKVLLPLWSEPTLLKQTQRPPCQISSTLHLETMFLQNGGSMTRGQLIRRHNHILMQMRIPAPTRIAMRHLQTNTPILRQQLRKPRLDAILSWIRVLHSHRTRKLSRHSRHETTLTIKQCEILLSKTTTVGLAGRQQLLRHISSRLRQVHHHQCRQST
jgi:hypothetical protein